MRKIKFALGLAAGLIVSTTALAAPMSCVLATGSQRGISCTCAAATCDAPSGAPTKPTAVGSATASVQLGAQVDTLDVKLCPTTAGASITASKVDVYFYDGGGWAVFGAGYTGSTSRAADGCIWMAFDSPGKGMPIISRRAAWAQVVPVTGTTLSAGGIRIEVYPSGPAGSL